MVDEVAPTAMEPTAWADRAIFVPMWGASQLGDPARLRRLLACFEAALGVEAQRLMMVSKPGAVDRMWMGRWHIWASVAVFAGAWTWLASRPASSEELMMATASLAAWTVAFAGLAFYLVPWMVFGVDPTRPFWARQGAPLDPGFVDWARSSLAALEPADRKQTAFLLPDDARALHDTWMALGVVRKMGEEAKRAEEDELPW